MKAKLLAILLLAAGVTTICITTATSNSINGEVKKNNDGRTTHTLQTPVSAAQQPADPPGTIDGSKNPELIPDKVAYSILFRFLSNRQSENEKDKVRAYLKQRLCANCSGILETSTSNLEPSTSNIVNALLAAAGQFRQQVSVLDNQVKSIKDQHWPNPSSDVMAQLKQLQDQKEALVLAAVASLQTRIDAEGRTRVQQFVHNNFKRKIKMSPGPQSPPGGPGWQPLSPTTPTGHHQL